MIHGRPLLRLLLSLQEQCFAKHVLFLRKHGKALCAESAGWCVYCLGHGIALDMIYMWLCLTRVQGLMELISSLQREMAKEQENFNGLTSSLQGIRDRSSRQYKTINRDMMASQTRLTTLMNRSMKCFSQVPHTRHMLHRIVLVTATLASHLFFIASSFHSLHNQLRLIQLIFQPLVHTFTFLLV